MHISTPKVSATVTTAFSMIQSGSLLSAARPSSATAACCLARASRGGFGALALGDIDDRTEQAQGLAVRIDHYIAHACR